MKPTLLHIIPFAHLGGTEKDCYYIIKAGKNFEHKVLVLDAYGPMVAQWQSEGAAVECLHIFHLSNKALAKNIEQKLINANYAGILYWSTIKLPIVRHALRHATSKLAVHVGNPCQLSKISTLKQWVYHTIFRSHIPTCLFACSGYVAQSLQKNSFYKLFENKVSMNPVELLPENPYIARELSVQSEIIIGMTARLDPIKDHEAAICAFALVHSEFPNSKLWLIGDGILRNKLETLSHNLGLSNAVVFWGNVANVYEKLRQMDIFIYATTEKEGLGNAVTEAMANGLPCVVSNLPMMHEIAGNEHNVIFTERGNDTGFAKDITNVLLNKEIRIGLSRNAFSRAISYFSAQRYLNDRAIFLHTKV